jgi:hypothetical protein
MTSIIHRLRASVQTIRTALSWTESAPIGTNHLYRDRGPDGGVRLLAVRAPRDDHERAMLAAWDRRRYAADLLGLRYDQSPRADLARLQIVEEIMKTNEIMTAHR